jgi:hypothetical protein
MSVDTVRIEGFEEADRLLAKIADPERRNEAFVGGLRQASEAVVTRARELTPAPGYPGDKPGLKALRDTLGHVVKQYTTTFVAVIGPQRPAGAHGHLVEGGTRRHVITAKSGKFLKLPLFSGGLLAAHPDLDSSASALPSLARRVIRRAVRHPGARAKPFMSPAATDTRPQQEAAIIAGINKLVNP